MFCIRLVWDAVKISFCKTLVAQSVASRPLLNHAPRQLGDLALAFSADQFASLVYLQGCKKENVSDHPKADFIYLWKIKCTESLKKI